ncbi:MAG: hypothetical protein JST52_12140, partial [Bacteroidetes bacterium]|nr:hypothetical protein [Bacteroidota bacterium]
MTLIFLLVWGYKAQSQQVISATNWLKVQTKQLPTSERNINVVPLGNTGYLFSIIEEIPFNFTPGWYYTSATLIKADVNGNVKKQITIRTDTLTNGYKGLATFVNNDEILWVVSIDSPIYNLNPANKKLAVFHIDIGTFSIRYVDTFPTPVKNATINNYWSAELPKGKFWLALQTGDFISYPSRTYIINIQSDMQNPAHWKPYWVDSICHIDTSGISLPLSFQVENSGAKLQLFATVSDTMMKQKVFLLDTLCRFQQEYTIENYPFLYSQGKHIFRNPQCNLYSSDSTTNFLGSSFDVENNNRWVGLIKARKNIKSYESVLLIPDVANMSYSWKNTPLFGGVTGLGTNVYCLSFDFTDPGNIYFNEIENHIYVGKTDTSLNGWHWYKYIGKP